MHIVKPSTHDDKNKQAKPQEFPKVYLSSWGITIAITNAYIVLVQVPGTRAR